MFVIVFFIFFSLFFSIVVKIKKFVGIQSIFLKLNNIKRQNSIDVQNYKNKLRFSNVEQIIAVIPNSSPLDSSEAFTKFVKEIYNLLNLLEYEYQMNLNVEELKKIVLPGETDSEEINMNFFVRKNIPIRRFEGIFLPKKKKFEEFEIHFLEKVWKKFQYDRKIIDKREFIQ